VTFTSRTHAHIPGKKPGAETKPAEYSPILHHQFLIYDPEHKVQLRNHLEIHTLELPKCPEAAKINTELERWVYFFRHGKHIDPANPPPLLRTGIMEQVMAVMPDISERETDYLAYRARWDFLREQLTVKNHFKEVEQRILAGHAAGEPGSRGGRPAPGRARR
jgi:hypothetical protein